MSLPTQQVADIRRLLVDPLRVCRLLGLAEGAQRQSRGGLTVKCPAHTEKTPSCSVTVGGDGTLRVRCFGCGWTGDVLSLVAATRKLDVRRDFREVLHAAAQLGGGHRSFASEGAVAVPNTCGGHQADAERHYPPEDEVLAVWAEARPVQEVEICHRLLRGRALSPGEELARALVEPQLPRWARYGGASWLETGHRIVLPVFDAKGSLRSLRAWQVDGERPGPKRLPPAGYRATGLVLANNHGRQMLRAPGPPLELLIAEGEPDFLSLCERYVGTAVLGVVSGSWSQAFADRVALGSLVGIRTHRDAAGDGYAAAIAQTLRNRAVIRRGLA